MISQRETDLQNQIHAIEKACREAHEQLEDLLKPVREPLGELAREVKQLQTERFTAETGLKIGDELYPTAEFVALQIEQHNGRWWELTPAVRPLCVGDSVFEYIHYGHIVVSQGASSVGGIPVQMALYMRHQWLLQQKVGF